MAPAKVSQVSVRACASSDTTRPMMNRPLACKLTTSRSGATTCSGNTEAPTASGNIGLKVV